MANKISEEKLENVLDKFKQALDEASKEFIDELKCDSETYEQVGRKLHQFETGTLYTIGVPHKMSVICFLNYVKEQIKKEMNDLPLTNRSRD